MTALSERQADEGFCCRAECCGPGSWCCAHADDDHACDGDDFWARRDRERNDALLSLLFFFAVVPPAVCWLALLLIR